MNKLYIPIHDDDTLRPYQHEAKMNIFCAWSEYDDVMFQMPTGTGKTRLFTSIIRDINLESISRKEPVKVLIVAHRTELIDQIDQSLDNYHVAHNVFKGSRKRRDTSKPVIVSSIQTITHTSNAADAIRLRHKVKYIIIDEAHHAMAESYQKLWEMFPDSKKLGVTATPWRMNHRGFCDLFQKLITSWSIKKFIKENWLSPYAYYSLKTSSYVKRVIDGIDEFDAFGDYKESALEQTMDVGKIRAQLLDSYKKLAWGKRGIIYSINKAHSKHICAEYRAAGLRVVDIDDKTPKEKRKQLVLDFKNGKIDIIVNVNIFSEGFDCPAIEFIQLASPTRSLSMYLQQVGRGLRIMEGKPRCLILDNVGMYSRFGLPDANRKWQKHFNGEDVEDDWLDGNGYGHSRYNDPDLSEGIEDMELIQEIEDQKPSIKKQLYKSLDDGKLFELWYDQNNVPHVEKVKPVEISENYGYSVTESELVQEESLTIAQTEPQDEKLLSKYIGMFKKLHCATVKGRKAPHKALLLLSIMKLIERGDLDKPRIDLCPELVAMSKVLAQKYNLVQDGKYPNMGMPYYHMKSEPFWSLKESSQPDIFSHNYTSLSLNSRFEYAEFDNDLFGLMQDEESRDLLTQILENEFNLHG